MSYWLTIFFRDVARGISSLVYPQFCIVCRRALKNACFKCLEIWSSRPRKTQLAIATSMAVVVYDNSVSTVILKAKEERNRQAQDLIAIAIFNSALQIFKRSNRAPCLLIPIPSSPSAIRKRGESFLHPIIRKVISMAKSEGLDWEWADLLVHTKKVRDQAGLNSQERQRNLEGVFELREGTMEARPIILIDDVITTGSTLTNAILAIRERNMTVLGAATACASAHQLLIR